MNRIFFFAMSAMLIIASLVACQKDKITTDYAAEAICTGEIPSYDTVVADIINLNCASAGCHNAASKKAGVNLSDYANAKDEFLNNDKNLASVHHDGSVKAMPDNRDKLSDDKINALDCWVQNGCPQ